MNFSVKTFRFAIFQAAAMVVFAGAGCGGERCAHDTCEPGSEVDAVVAVPDSFAGGDAADASGADTTRDDVAADTMADVTCCDPETGECGTCDDECWSCAGNWECRSGLFCLTIPGYAGICTPLCSTVAECPDSEQYTCTFWSDFGVCVPNVNKCPGCYAPTPFPLGDTCVECRDGRDCGGGGACCHPEYHFCMVMSCGPGTIFNPELCECRQCFTGDDCLRFEDATGVCLVDGTCEGVVPCDGLCNESYPICAVVKGVEQCVECASDEDCGETGCVCLGDPWYRCVEESGSLCGSGGSCAAPCRDSGDCHWSQMGNRLECAWAGEPGTGPAGVCVDPSGSCDGMTSCCRPGKGCLNLIEVVEEIAGTPLLCDQIECPAPLHGVCQCDTGSDCPGEIPCTDTAILCTSGVSQMVTFLDVVCPDGQLAAEFPERICIEPAALLEYFGIAGA